MKQLLKNIYYSLPVQLLILHFRKYQVLLLLWAILFSTINSGFLTNFGADALFFVPEYLGKVNMMSSAIVGVTMGMLFMAWNVTTFILHSKRCKFLATTGKPFLKYCTNNALFPLFFLVFYIVRLIQFDSNRELMHTGNILVLIIGLIGGLTLMLFFSLLYFFSAEKTILRQVAPIVKNVKHFRKEYDPASKVMHEGFGMKVGYYLSTGLRLRQARPVSHYNPEFLDMIFKRHHFAAIMSIILAFLLLIMVGFFLDTPFFQLPAAASIFIFWAVMMATIGAFTYFMQSWSLIFAIVILFFLNVLYENEYIDLRNKAYGLDYINKADWPQYSKTSLSQLCTPDHVHDDLARMQTVLGNWKKNQPEEKPLMILINVSGGGLRSATFTMNTLQRLDSMCGGQLMPHTFMISGASGGMLAATYYRELYRIRQNGSKITLTDNQYTDNISADLLNPVFSSMVTRDIFSPVQKFTMGENKYVKDRGYSFEEKLSDNTNGILNRQLKDFVDDEEKAKVPLIMFNSVITRDGRKMMLCSQPVSFMMKPFAASEDTTASPDAVDFSSLFRNRHPMDVRLLTALRMNATFPYVLPNVWLPTQPVIDVMDAGLRDNFGQDISLRFIEYFREWMKVNTSGVVMLQIRDRVNGDWEHPFEGGSITDILVKPATMLQHNWQKLQDYFEDQEFSLLSDPFFKRLQFIYTPEKEETGATLNFHLTAKEKRDVIAAFDHPHNSQIAWELVKLLK